MWIIGKWIKAYSTLKKLSRPLDFAKLFSIPDGQVVVVKSYPQITGDTYDLVQTTMVVGKTVANITSSYATEAQMIQAFDDFDQGKAIEFNKQIQDLL